MIALFFISLAVFILGISAIVWNYGVPASISESYYLLPTSVRVFVFYIWTIIVALPLIIFWIELSEGKSQFLIFFGGAFLVGVGAAAPFKDNEMIEKVHVICALCCSGFTQLWILIYTSYWILSIAMFILFYTIGKKTIGRIGYENKSYQTVSYSVTFFLELAAFLSTYIAVYGYYKLQL